ASGYFTNFTGTAGVWRRAAIVDAGGWSARTLTEDLDLSYRAQLRGWKAVYLEDLVVPEELPVSIDAYRRQQSRWATGSFQSAFHLLGAVLLSPHRPALKLQATMHLLAYGVGPVMLLQLACYPLMLAAFTTHGVAIPSLLAYASAVAIFVGVSPWIGFMVAQTRRGRPWWSGLPSFLCQLVGAGMSLNTLIALARATRSGGEFVRTPKHRIVRRGQEWRDQAYVHVGDPRALLEGALGMVTLVMVPIALALGQDLLAVYAAMFACGFLLVAALSAFELVEVLALRNLGRRALMRVRAAAPVAGLFALAAILLLAAAQMAEPFEDGYGHWLMAANLAATGQLHDPLFGMEDTWLPGYQLLAAAVLRTFGLWQLGALKVMSAAFGLATVAMVYALAPNVRQSRLAVVLLVLNPVFLFTSGSAVVEPLVTALLMGASLAAMRARWRLAGLLAVLGCLTSTKAWIWIGVAAGVAGLEALRTRAPARRRLPGLAWAMPAVALLVFLQLGFAPASHSVARGSIEVLSAAHRGSIPAGAAGRLAELAGTFGLAALPLFAFGLLGLVAELRRGLTPAVRFIYLPAAFYLAAVFALVAAGAYTGSDRYLYPALPAIALLAAAALDRQGAAIRVLAVAATGLLAVAFLPVFSGFAAQNSGLVAAGKATSGGSGVLVTDSPVVAYYSHRQPSQITGSEALPLDRGAALAWMRDHKVGDLALEDISYYRATSVFPDLARGQVAAPFTVLGDQARYQAPGGKPVFAYRLGPELYTQSIFPGVDACIDGSPGAGKTAPLAKGIVLEVAGTDASGEGMGFGVPIVRYPDGWAYAGRQGTADTSSASGSTWTRTFQLDEIGGDAAHGYRFAPTPSRGSIEVTYRVDSTGILIAVRPLWLTPGFSQVGILNEQSAAFNDLRAQDMPAPLLNSDFPRWIAAGGEWARLQSRGLGVQWSVPSLPGAQLFGGREHNAPDFDWAGLDYMFNATFSGVTYRVNVKEAN
ncbi:MAG TPA: glycosyltransferase, partial [Candidatus Dormibacteraeota bacterium]